MYIVMGVPGAGKTTVLEKFIENNPEWEIVNYGTLMFNIAKLYGINDRDEMRKSPIEIQKKIQEEVANKLSEISKNKNKILDTHAAIKTPSGYLPGLPEKTLKKMKVDGLILITADPDEILSRRRKDKTRKRDEEGENQLKEHISININMCSTYSVITGAPFKIINNKEGKIKETVEHLENVLLG